MAADSERGRLRHLSSECRGTSHFPLPLRAPARGNVHTSPPIEPVSVGSLFGPINVQDAPPSCATLGCRIPAAPNKPPGLGPHVPSSARM
eukprot:9428209-Pyramimonas_sp.AAC.1